MPEIQILVVGDIQRTEFRESASCLKRSAVVEIAADVATAHAALARRRTAPEVIVVAQSFPDQFSHESIDRLRRAAPLARILGLMGSWCEGEMRSGRPWPATVRLYWHQWPARCRRQFHRLANGERCSFALSATATEEERLLADAVSPLPSEVGPGSISPLHSGVGPGSISPLPLGEGQGVRAETSGQWSMVSGQDDTSNLKSQINKSIIPNPQSPIPNPFSGLAVVRCQSFETWDWLRATCRRRGLSAVWQRDGVVAQVAGATAAIFDCADLNDEELDDLGRLSAALRPAPVIAMMSFPRIDDHRRALSAGAAAVLSKPLLVDELFAEINAAAEVGS